MNRIFVSVIDSGSGHDVSGGVSVICEGERCATYIECGIPVLPCRRSCGNHVSKPSPDIAAGKDNGCKRYRFDMSSRDSDL